MSDQITTAFVNMYHANVMHLSQQKGSRLRDKVRNESQSAEADFYDRIGQTTAQKRTDRHGDTKRVDTPHSRRRVTIEPYDWSDLIDKPDKVRTLINPESEYVLAAVWAMGRAQDDVIIEKALDNAYSGKEGSVAVPLPNSQKVAATDGATAAGVNLNILTLRKVAKKFDDADVDEAIMRFFAFSSSQKESLLATTEVTSADFNTVKALVMGQIDTFMGFKFVRSQRLGVTSAATTFELANGDVGSGAGSMPAGARRCFAWAKDGLLLALGQDIQTRISERDDKNYSTQVFASQDIGATRMEEVKVVEVLCNES